jgi:hypothetical protein
LADQEAAFAKVDEMDRPSNSLCQNLPISASFAA